MIVRSYAKLDLQHDPVIDVLMETFPRFLITAETYPLRKSTEKYMMLRHSVSQQEERSPEAAMKPKPSLSDTDAWDLRQSSMAVDISVGAPPRPISLVWMLEALYQWNLARSRVRPIERSMMRCC